MSRPTRLSLLLSLALLVLGLAGCGTMYTAMYSPGRSRFVSPPEPKAAPEPSAESLLPPVNPNNPPPPSAGMLDPGFPTTPSSAQPPVAAPAAAAGGEAAPGMAPIPGL